MKRAGRGCRDGKAEAECALSCAVDDNAASAEPTTRESGDPTGAASMLAA